jgi:hypothetical protein
MNLMLDTSTLNVIDGTCVRPSPADARLTVASRAYDV